MEALTRRYEFRSLVDHLLVDVAQAEYLNGSYLNEAKKIALAVPARTDETDFLDALISDLFGEQRASA